jgi:hypothetical protein
MQFSTSAMSAVGSNTGAAVQNRVFHENPLFLKQPDVRTLLKLSGSGLFIVAHDYG